MHKIPISQIHSTPSLIGRAEGESLYTILVFSENLAGILNQVTAVFTRRQINIESLNVCASSTPGVHKYTITCYCTEEMVKVLKAQIEKRIDVLQARFYTDDEIFLQETSLLKISTPAAMENPEVCRIVRHHGARIVEVNPTYMAVEKTGTTEDILMHPRHPYTVGLLNSVPKLQAAKGDLVSIKGAPPRLNELPDYCAFYDRCPHACEKCKESGIPVLEQVGENEHFAACHCLQETVNHE